MNLNIFLFLLRESILHKCSVHILFSKIMKIQCTFTVGFLKCSIDINANQKENPVVCHMPRKSLLM